MFTSKEIAAIRLSLGMTPAQFAFAMGVSENTVRRWEIGDRHPSYKRMESLDKLRKGGPDVAYIKARMRDACEEAKRVATSP
jgi:DNA-binding transcriptional regulator YiaG